MCACAPHAMWTIRCVGLGAHPLYTGLKRVRHLATSRCWIVRWQPSRTLTRQRAPMPTRRELERQVDWGLRCQLSWALRWNQGWIW